ncbi:hypothetical protein IKG16_03210 [Candidatus Saccharibacteria bacterium]|nr:hypothetical protein [Candidatus Saccharibacteria bacterium]
MVRSKISHLISILFSLLFTILSCNNAFAEISINTLRMYSLNNILGYDPDSTIDSKNDPCGGGYLSGETNFAKVVSYFSGNNSKGVSVGVNGIAAIASNFQAESGFGPMVGEGGHITDGKGYGIAQFTPYTKITNILKTDNRTKDTFNKFFTEEYAHKLTSEAEKATGVTDGVPISVNDAWLETELDYIVDSEFNSTTVGNYRHKGGEMGLDYIPDSMTIAEALDAAKNASDAARIFTWIYERPKNKEADATKRANAVNDLLSQVEAYASNNNWSPTTNATQKGDNVTIIGDSITERSKNDITSLLPEVDIYAQVSKQFYSNKVNEENPDGYHILQNLIDNKKLRDVLVYALGTNNAGLTQKEAQAVVDLAGKDRTVIFVTNYSADDSHDYTSNNNVFNKMRNDNPNVRIADWAGAANNKDIPDIMADAIHPTIGTGTNIFAHTIFSTIYNDSSNECRVSGGNGSINETAIELSWPDRTHKLDDPKPSYKAALAEVGLDRYDEDYVKIGASCDAFVATVLTYSGADPNAAAICCGAANLQRYFLSHPELYEQIENTGSNSNLKPGDILSSTGHVEIYVEKDGEFKIASASHGDRTADHAGEYRNKSGYLIFRVKGQ